MSTINQLLEESAGGWKNLQNDAARMASKWGKTGLLEGLDETGKNNMAMILENQAKQLVVESNSTGQGGATFTAGAGDQCSWSFSIQNNIFQLNVKSVIVYICIDV